MNKKLTPQEIIRTQSKCIYIRVHIISNIGYQTSNIDIIF